MWDGLTEETLDTLTRLGAPPNGSYDGLTDANWLGLFSDYAQANGISGTQANAMAALWELATRQETPDDLRAIFTMINTEGSHPCDIPPEIYEALAFPSRNEEASLYSQLRIEFSIQLSDWWDAFVAEVANTVAGHQAVADDEQYVQTIGVDELDRDYVDRVNEYELKELDQGGRIGFVQAGDIVLIGGNFPANYTQAVRGAAASEGTLTMVAKGSTFSAGKISVSDYVQPDPDSLKTALKRVTRKSISFS